MKKNKKNFVAILKINNEISIYGNGNCKDDAVKDAVFQYNTYKEFIEPKSKDVKTMEVSK